jgi:HAD superfamily hydrolase (TIGR01484 family)
VSARAAVEPRPLADMPVDVCRQIRGVLTDIDDTLTTDGVLPPVARASLDALAGAGIPVVAITGRPAGLCEQLLVEWPLAAIVGENGGVWMRRDPKTGAVAAHYEHDADERARQRAALADIAHRALAAVPRAALAVDRHRRETDVAIDWAERIAPLTRAEVDRLVELLRAEGLTTAVSSIHVHGWYGVHDKLATTQRLFAAAFGVDLRAERGRYTYVGDAPNDAPMFAFFPHAVGVANLRRFLDRIDTPPAYITEGEAGAGFREVADRLLAARRAV